MHSQHTAKWVPQGWTIEPPLPRRARSWRSCNVDKPFICSNMTGRNPPNSFISLLTPEESLLVFLKAVLAAAKSSLLERPAMASSVKPFPFPEKSHKIQNYSTRHNETLQQPSSQDLSLGFWPRERFWERGWGYRLWILGTRYPISEISISSVWKIRHRSHWALSSLVFRNINIHH